ncbi:hypothetical protein PR048_003146 [Dryococelus australis]|uniref:Uncharacterized protein n=1 Tax=Dryococelus australis TaxID=614101 RepID=A0ABQ9IM78_9NEOP|nr:hypothetical protein PR048_003146 [Dryococelus australis]
MFDGFSRGSPASPALCFRCCSILISLHRGLQDLDVKSLPNIFTPSLTNYSFVYNALRRLGRGISVDLRREEQSSRYSFNLACRTSLLLLNIQPAATIAICDPPLGVADLEMSSAPLATRPFPCHRELLRCAMMYSYVVCLIVWWGLAAADSQLRAMQGSPRGGAGPEGRLSVLPISVAAAAATPRRCDFNYPANGPAEDGARDLALTASRVALPCSPALPRHRYRLLAANSESIVYIQNSIAPLDCQRIKVYVTLSEDCEASRAGGRGWGRYNVEFVSPRLITSAHGIGSSLDRDECASGGIYVNYELPQSIRVIEGSMEQHRNERVGETGDPRENPLTSGIVRHDSHMRKSGRIREHPAEQCRRVEKHGDQGLAPRPHSPPRVSAGRRRPCVRLRQVGPQFNKSLAPPSHRRLLRDLRLAAMRHLMRVAVSPYSSRTARPQTWENAMSPVFPARNVLERSELSRTHAHSINRETRPLQHSRTLSAAASLTFAANPLLHSPFATLRQVTARLPTPEDAALFVRARARSRIIFIS